MIRVLHVVDSLDLGGAQTVILQIAQHLDRERFSMEVATMHGRGFFTDKLEKEGIRVHCLARSKYVPFYIPNFIRLITTQKFDVFHFHLFGANWIAKPLAALMGNRALIAHDHCNDNYRSAQPLHIWLDRLTNLASAKILAVSDSTARFLTEIEKIDPAKVLYLKNGIDTVRFQPAGEEIRKINRQKLGLPQDAVVVGGVGRFHPQKNFSLFLEIAALMRNQPHVFFALAGTGPEEEALRQKAADLGLGERLVFTGLISDMPALYSALDVLLLTSRYEGMPMTILEAMASGIPAVGSNLDGVKEIITDGRNGFLAESGNTTEFAEKLTVLTANPDIRRAMGAAARSHILSHYNISGMVSSLETLYKEAVS
ncbi:MAG: glycosyltransferase [Chthoniobacterales bacterium]